MPPRNPNVPLFIRKELALNEINWESVLHLLIEKYHCPASHGRHLLTRFIERLHLPFEPAWFRRTKLSAADNLIIAALCQAHGADSIVLRMKADLSSFGIRCGYEVMLTLQPERRALPKTSGGQIIALGKVTLGTLQVPVRDYAQAVAWRALALITLVLAYIVVIGTLLYGLAAILLLTEYPLEAALKELNHNPTFIALLLAITAVAALVGRIVIYLVRRLLSRRRS
jgi:hypothetical protein